MRAPSVLVLILSAAICCADDNGDDDTDEQRVYQALADYTANRDQVNQRYAYHAIYERHTTARPDVGRLYLFSVGDKKAGFHYWTRGAFYATEQDWSERYVLKGRHFNRNFVGSTYRQKKPDETQQDFEDWGNPPELMPFDKLFIPDQLTMRGRKYCPPGVGLVEFYFLQNGQLQSAHRVGGLLKSEWVWFEHRRAQRQCYDVTLTMDSGKAYLPTEIKVVHPSTTQHVRVSWAKQSGLWVPTHIRAVADIPEDQVQQSYFVKLIWKVGKQVPEAMLRTEGVTNFLPQVLEPFEVIPDAIVGNVRIRGSEWVTPPDLYDALRR